MEEDVKEIKYISITDERANKLQKFITDRKIPSIIWATRMGLAIGIIKNKKVGKSHGGKGHGVNIDSVDPEGYIRLLVGKDVAHYARGGLDILINELENGKEIYDIFIKYSIK